MPEEPRDMELVEMLTTEELVNELGKRFDEVLIVGRTRKGIDYVGERRIMACNRSYTTAYGLAEKALRFYDQCIDDEIDYDFSLIDQAANAPDDDDEDKPKQGVSA